MLRSHTRPWELWVRFVDGTVAVGVPCSSKRWARKMVRRLNDNAMLAAQEGQEVASYAIVPRLGAPAEEDWQCPDCGISVANKASADISRGACPPALPRHLDRRPI